MRKYDKLVRDNIPQIMHEKGKKFNVAKVGSKSQFRDYILRKLDEEYNEFKAAAKDNNMFGIEEELADIYEVLDAACEFVGNTSKARVMQKKEEKAGHKGRFYTGTILVEGEE
jgi:predicted house-cleaning noncanonical NTP pyrophosphatase (MazG superfamily)